MRDRTYIFAIVGSIVGGAIWGFIVSEVNAGGNFLGIIGIWLTDLYNAIGQYPIVAGAAVALGVSIGWLIANWDGTGGGGLETPCTDTP